MFDFQYLHMLFVHYLPLTLVPHFYFYVKNWFWSIDIQCMWMIIITITKTKLREICWALKGIYFSIQLGLAQLIFKSINHPFILLMTNRIVIIKLMIKFIAASTICEWATNPNEPLLGIYHICFTVRLTLTTAFKYWYITIVKIVLTP